MLLPRPVDPDRGPAIFWNLHGCTGVRPDTPYNAAARPDDAAAEACIHWDVEPAPLAAARGAEGAIYALDVPQEIALESENDRQPASLQSLRAAICMHGPGALGGAPHAASRAVYLVPPPCTAPAQGHRMQGSGKSAAALHQVLQALLLAAILRHRPRLTARSRPRAVEPDGSKFGSPRSPELRSP